MLYFYVSMQVLLCYIFMCQCRYISIKHKNGAHIMILIVTHVERTTLKLYFIETIYHSFTTNFVAVWIRCGQYLLLAPWKMVFLVLNRTLLKIFSWYLSDYYTFVQCLWLGDKFLPPLVGMLLAVSLEHFIHNNNTYNKPICIYCLLTHNS